MLLFSTTSFFQIFALPSVRSSENTVTKSEAFVENVCLVWICLGFGCFFCFFFSSAQIILVSKRLHIALV